MVLLRVFFACLLLLGLLTGCPEDNGNRAPVAAGDTVTLAEDTSTVVNVLANDADDDNDPLTIVSVSAPANGQAVNNGDNVTYTPNADFNGTDTFTYTITDGQGHVDTATVSVTITPVDEPLEGAVFVGTNHNNTGAAGDGNPFNDDTEPGNRVVMYHRATDGFLTLVGYFDTGGQGSGPGQRFAGDGLGAAHSVQLSRDRSWLFVTNAGSNSVSVFRVETTGLVLVDVEPTGDGSANLRFPNSVTQFGNLVYVLNAADEGSITGFQLAANGDLTPLPNSTRILNANQQRFAPDALLNPAQVSFTPDGTQLIVTIKDGVDGLDPQTPATGPGRILVFNVNAAGLPSANFVQTNVNNRGPFGFSFDTQGNLLVAQFIGGTNLTGAAGSFQVNADGTLTPITAAEDASNQIDTCWLENNGVYAFGANYTSGTISSFTIGVNGSLTLLNATAGLTDPPNPARTQGSTPLDLGISDDGRFLYNVLPGSGRVAAWRINADGSLTKIDEFSGLGQTIQGDQAPVDFGTGESPAGIAVY